MAKSPAKERFFRHPTALVESKAIGAGTRIWAFAHVLPGARVGKSCNICDHVYVEGGAAIGNRVTIKNNVALWSGVKVADDVFIGPAVVFTNDLTPRAFLKKGKSHWLPTRIGKGATLGAGSVILCDLQIGEYAMVAAGAVVTKSVAPHTLVAGNPARVVGYVCRCLAMRVHADGAESRKCRKCGVDPVKSAVK